MTGEFLVNKSQENFAEFQFKKIYLLEQLNSLMRSHEMGDQSHPQNQIFNSLTNIRGLVLIHLWLETGLIHVAQRNPFILGFIPHLPNHQDKLKKLLAKSVWLSNKTVGILNMEDYFNKTVYLKAKYQ